MKSKLLATHLGIQNQSDFLESLRADNWLGKGLASSFSAAPASQSPAGPLVESIATPGPQQLAFTAGNIVVYRIGDGAAALSSAATAVFLDEYTTAGTYVQTIIMPTADGVGGVNNQMLTASGTSTAEGLLNRSVDGRYLLLTGYDAPTGTLAINGTTGAAFPRVVGRVAADGTFDTSTRLADFASSSSPRSAISTDGTDLWITGGAGGVRYTTLGATSSLQLATTPTNFRGIDMFDGQLYVSALTGATRIATVGSGHPTTAGQTVANVPGTPATTLGSPYGFFMADLDGIAGVDTLYVCDDGIGLLKFSLVSGSWVSSGTIGTNADDYFGLTGSVSGTTVTLYATRLNGGGADTIVSVIDSSGFGGTLTATATTLVTAAANTAFRGLDFAPTPGGPVTPTLSINDVTMAEGDGGTTIFTFTVSLSAASASNVTFDIATADGTAQDDNPGTEDNDYVAQSLTAQTITAGNTTYSFQVTVNGDLTAETNETFFVNVTNVVGATVNDGQGQGTITNDDTPGSFSVDDVTHLEGNSGNTAFTFTITRTGGTDGAVDVSYTVAAPGGAGFADSGDFAGGTLFAGTASFIDGQTTQTITLNVAGDISIEPTETFTITLTGATGGGTIGDGSGTGTITNDDSPPVISIADASTAEGNDGVTYLVLTVSLDHATGGDVTVDFDTTNGSALAGSDYVDHDGQLTIAAGQTSGTISIPLIGDTNPENAETLTVTLSNPSGGTLGDATATGTITNDDGSGYYSLAGGSFTQNWTSTGQITTDDNWSGVPYIIGYLGDIDAGTTANVDPRTLTGANLGAIDVIANQSSTAISNGGVAEFEITNPTIALNGSGTADAPSIVLYMDATGRSGVRLQANLRDIDATDDAAQQVNVQYRTSPGGPWTNVPGAYFADVTTAGSATQVTALNVLLPAGADNAATLEIRIMTTNAGGNDEWVGIDDIVVSSQAAGPSISIANAAVYEGDAGPTIITFTVTRTGSTSGAVDAEYEVNFGSGPFAAGTDDFTVGSPISGVVHFDDGQTTATVTASVDGDVDPEGDENFTIVLSNPSAGATIGDGTATGTIVNDDGTPPLVTINDVSVVEGDSGSVNLVFTVTRTGGTGAFDVDFFTTDLTATSAVGPGQDYVSTSGTVNFLAGEISKTISVPVLGDTDSELSETLQVTLTNATNFALITDATGIGTIASDDPIFIHDIQGTSYFSPILAGEGITSFNSASAGTVIVRAVVTVVDNDGPRQGFYLQEEVTDWDGNNFTSEGIFVMTRNDAGLGAPAVDFNVAVGDIVTVTAHVMEYQGFASNMPITALTVTSPSSVIVNSTGNTLPTLLLDAGHPMPTAIMTLVQPDYTDSADGVGDTFDASLYALSFWETVEGMLVTIPDMVVADGFVSTSGGQPIFQAYSQTHADADQINSRGGYTIAGDPPVGPPDTVTTEDDTIAGGRHLSDGDVNPDIIEVDFTGFAIDAPAGLTTSASMGDELGDITGIVDFDFTDRKLFVTDIDSGSFVDHITTQDVTVLGDDSRSLTVATFNVENLDPTDAPSKFAGLAAAIANNLNMPDILSIEEMQDNNGAAAGDGIEESPGVDVTGSDASVTWQKLVDALNTLTGAHYQWVDQAPIYNAEGGEQSGNIRVGFLYNTDRVQLGDLDANATLTERRTYTDRIGDGVRDAGDLIAFSDDMLGAEIQTADWANTRRSLLGQFTFNGNTVFVTANHFPAKGGSDEFWEFNQNPAAGEPTNAGWSQRNAVAQDVYSMLNLIESGAPGGGIVSGGDYNDFYFYRPLTTVTGYTMADGTARVGGARFENLTLTLPEAERYTYNFDGRSQAIDHVVVNGTLGAVASYDVVHINTGFNSSDSTPLSDHDPGLSSFDLRSFSEILNGTAGADLIDGFGGNDVIHGLGGNDILIGGAGADTMEGGLGNDRYFVDDAGDVVTEAMGEGTDRILTSVTYLLAAGSEIETLTTDDNLGTAAINLTGNELDSYLFGNAGANILDGKAGTDVLLGLEGNDRYFVESAGDRVIEFVGGGSDRVLAAGNFVLDPGSEVEVLTTTDNLATTAINLTGNELDSYLFGNAGANILDGKGGTDVLLGLEGNDRYFVESAGDRVIEFAGGGFDRVLAAGDFVLDPGSEVEMLTTTDSLGSAAIAITGNALAQYLFGNEGVNALDGKLGSDVMTGFGGADTFAFTTVLGATNIDRITDFQAGVDEIALDDFIFTALGIPGALDANAFFAGAAAHDADDRIIYNQATGAVYYDYDGNGIGTAVMFAILDTKPVIAASDFTVI